MDGLPEIAAPSRASGAAAVSARPRIVIIGAGFGGLTAAMRLGRVDATLIVIDRRNHHLFQPLLYQVATAALSPADIAAPIRGILARQTNTRVILGTVSGVDVSGRSVLIGERRIPYDQLVIATGARDSYFGHDEWAAVTLGLKTIEEATAMRRRILIAFERAEDSDDEAERRRLLTFVIIGGGPTGVELAGALAELARAALARDFRRIDPTTARIVLVEAEPRLLPSFPPQLSAVAAADLARLGVELRLGVRVTRCDPDGAVLGDDRIESRTLIWAAGVAASPAAAWLGVEAGRSGRVPVGPDLRPSWTPRDLRHRRHCAGRGAARPVAGCGAGGKAARRLCRPGYRGGSRRRAGTRPVPLSRSRQPGGDRAQGGGRRFWLAAAHRPHRLADLGQRAHLFSDRLPQPNRDRDQLVVVVSDASARRSPDHRSGHVIAILVQRLLPSLYSGLPEKEEVTDAGIPPNGPNWGG